MQTLLHAALAVLALTLALPSAGSAQEVPAEENEEVEVEIVTQTRGVTLYRVDRRGSTYIYEDLCRAPCFAMVPRRGEYYFGGPGLDSSEHLSFEDYTDEVVAHVDAASTEWDSLGSVLMIIGGMLAAGGALLVTIGTVDRLEETAPGTAITGGVALGLAIGVFVGGLVGYLSVGSTVVELNAPSAR